MDRAEQYQLGFQPLKQSYDCCVIEVDALHFMLNVYNKGYHPSKNTKNHQWKKLKSFLKAMGENTDHVDTVGELVRLAKLHLNKPVGGRFWPDGDFGVDVHEFFPIR